MSSFGRAVLAILNQIWLNSTTPDVWQSAIVVSVFKKGDPTDPDNYRGISVMGSVMKLLLTVVANRLDAACEEHAIYCQSQAGFRRLEECPLQIASLLEIGKRREAIGEPTYVAFVDFRKAYDTVPHELLFQKLHHLGFRGHMLHFIKALYRDSTFQVRTGAPPYRFSDPIPLRRGLRQGCPASPTLFNIFINDIFSGASHHGCSVPGGSRLNSPSSCLVPGLVFADDAVATTPSIAALKDMLDHLSGWATDHFMRFGILKCGVMALGVHANHAALQAMAHRLTLGGERVPIVDEYRYLGAIIRSDMSIRRIIDDRIAKGERAAAALHPFLSNPAIPLHMRTLALKVCVLPVFSYAAEAWGMGSASSGIARMQTVVNRSIRTVIDIAKTAVGVSMPPIWRELSIAPIAATTAALRARAFLKAQQLHTYIRGFVAMPFRSRNHAWSNGTVRWLNKWASWPGVATSTTAPFSWSTGIEPRLLADKVRKTVWECADTSDVAQQSMNRYSASVFPSLLSLAANLPLHLAPSLPIILQLRTRAFPTTRRLAKARTLPDRFLQHCPVCAQPVPESIPHMLIECPRWASVRAVLHDSASALMRTIHSLAASVDDQATMLLGGTPQSPIISDQHRELALNFTKTLTDAFPHIACYVLHLSQIRKAYLREIGVHASSRIIRTGPRPDG